MGGGDWRGGCFTCRAMVWHVFIAVIPTGCSSWVLYKEARQEGGPWKTGVGRVLGVKNEFGDRCHLANYYGCAMLELFTEALSLKVIPLRSSFPQLLLPTSPLPCIVLSSPPLQATPLLRWLQPMPILSLALKGRPWQTPRI